MLSTSSASSASFPSIYSVGSFCIILFGYILQSTFLQYYFYYHKASNLHAWKIRTDKKESCVEEVAKRWWLPVLMSSYKKPGREKHNPWFAPINLLVASIFAFLITEATMWGMTRLRFEATYNNNEIQVYICVLVVRDLLLAVMWQSVLEYYWHRLMHTKCCYKMMHKYHHANKSPEPFDDMYIHPLEAFGYYCILYSYPVVFECHFNAFVTYMVIMGLCGVLDHSGIRVCIPYLYDTRDHDLHHERFDVNYAFPFPYMDILHNTWEVKT